MLRQTWARLPAIVLIAFLVRAGFVLTRPASFDYPDEVAYDRIARHLVAGRGLVEGPARMASRAPGYPLFLAGWYAVAGHRLWVVRVAQSVVGACLCILVFVLSKRAFPGSAGLVAAATAAVYPFFIFYTGLILTETLFTTALVACVLLFTVVAEEDRGPGPDIRRRPGLREGLVCAACGAAFGVTVLIRSSLLLFFPFYLPFLLLCGAAGRGKAAWLRTIRRLAIVAAAGCLVQAPWVWRNYRVYGRIVPTTLQVGASLFEGNSAYADGGPCMDRIDWDGERPAWLREKIRRAESGASTPRQAASAEYENDRWFRGLAVDYIRRHPGRFARLALARLGRFWNPVPNYSRYRTPLYILVSLVSYVPVLCLGVAGMALAGHRWRFGLLLLAPILYFSALHAVFVGSIRYRAPVMPFLMVFAGHALARLVRGRVRCRAEGV